MKTILVIALRNVIRHRKRVLLTSVTMMAGIGIFIFMDSLLSGLDRGSIDNMIHLRESSVKVFTRDYENERKSFPLKYGIEEASDFETFLKRDGRVRAVAPRVRFIGELSNGKDGLPVIGTVIDPEKDAEVFALKQYLQGSYLGGTEEHRVLLGKDLAEEMGVAVGNSIVLSAQTRFGSRNALDFSVAGILSTTDPEVNGSSVFISMADAENFLELGGLITEYNVALHRKINLSDALSDARSVRDAVNAQFASLVAFSFEDMGKAFLDVMGQKKVWGILMILVILLIAAVGIVNTVLMSVYERIREIGVLRALGYKSSEILSMFLWEGIFIGILGSSLGLALGIGLNAYLVTSGFSIDVMGGKIDTKGVPFWGTIYGEWNIGTIVFAFLFGVAVALVASLIPARKASRISVTSALKFV